MRRTGRLIVDRPAGPALRLLTPEGERAWVDGNVGPRGAWAASDQ